MEAKKLHLIAWHKTCKPKKYGGLGISDLKALQFANACSLLCRFYNSSSPLFSYLNAKYGTPWTPTHIKISVLWADIVKAAASLGSSISFNITTQSKIAFLWDPWVGGSSINNLCSSSNLTEIIPQHSKISDFILDGDWSLPDVLNPTILPYLQNILLEHDPINSIGWKDHKRICFSSFILYYFREEIPFCWHKLIWHKHHALKYSCYTWLALNGGLKTADELIKRSIGGGIGF
ncbi:hypothetical protein M5K25_007458 [Dendrobium thyrsiflorum]|uniref:Reverse transcriptase zinc-binding domain-containing protein n=1 Tax=Dendrobium thyrsiflorum TaxID=117978 RepID=A0ABD0VDZ7_DENTH